MSIYYQLQLYLIVDFTKIGFIIMLQFYIDRVIFIRANYYIAFRAELCCGKTAANGQTTDIRLLHDLSHIDVPDPKALADYIFSSSISAISDVIPSCAFACAAFTRLYTILSMPYNASVLRSVN